jgi:thiol reductant ABC exporter CydC subunit
MTATLRTLLALAGASRRGTALAVGLGSLTIVLGVGLTASAGYLISRAAEQPAVLSLTTVIVAVRFFALSRPIARYLERLSSHDLALRDLARVRVRSYERLEPLAPGQLESYRKGDLLSRFVGDIDTLQNLHLRGVGPPLVALIAGVTSVVVTALLLPVAGAVLAGGLLLTALVAPFATLRFGRRAGRRQAAIRGELTGDLVELLAGAPELVAYGQHEERLQRVRDRDRELVGLGHRDALADGTGEAIRVALTGLTVTGVLAVAVAAHAAGTLDAVLIATLGLLALASFEAVQPLPQAGRELGETITAGRRVLDLFAREAPVTDPDDPAPLPTGPVEVALERVAARYLPSGPRVLHDFSIRLRPASRVALIGPSGAGKTTVTNLLLRFLDPEDGRVTLAGRDLRDYRQEDVRRTIAVAGQDSHLFSTSIRENVRIGRPGASDDELELALRRAGIQGWVTDLPDGLDTLVGEQGRELSGGQRQRLTIARALLADAPLLVLDEPTAHLDEDAAQRLVEDVFEAAGNRAVLLITHRREGLDLVDEIHVLGQDGGPEPPRPGHTGTSPELG